MLSLSIFVSAKALILLSINELLNSNLFCQNSKLEMNLVTFSLITNLLRSKEDIFLSTISLRIFANSISSKPLIFLANSSIQCKPSLFKIAWSLLKSVESFCNLIKSTNNKFRSEVFKFSFSFVLLPTR